MGHHVIELTEEQLAQIAAGVSIVYLDDNGEGHKCEIEIVKEGILNGS